MDPASASTPELIEPAHPEQNGRHERMHKTLKAETTRPPRGQPERCSKRVSTEFRNEYNEERPHEGLGQRRQRRLTMRRRGSSLGSFRGSNIPATSKSGSSAATAASGGSVDRVCVTQTLAGEHVRSRGSRRRIVGRILGPIKLGRMDERKLRIEDHRGRWVRQTVLPMSPD